MAIKISEDAKKNVEMIKDDLRSQLEERNIMGKHYDDLIEDYGNYYIIKDALNKDILKRGVQCRYDNGGGQKGYKKNESIAEYNKTTVVMLKIISELGLKPPASKDIGGGDDDDTP